MKPRIVRTEKQKPKTASTESQDSNQNATPGTVRTEEVKPRKPTTER